MHDILPQLGANAQVIQSYGAAGFRIGNADYATSVLVMPTKTFAWSGELTVEALAPLLIVSPLEGEDASLGERAGGEVSPPHGIAAATSRNARSPSGGELDKVELLLIGTGARHEMIAPAERAMLKARGIAIDTMDTGAACRTFNVLLAEGRRVGAVLRLPI